MRAGHDGLVASLYPVAESFGLDTNVYANTTMSDFMALIPRLWAAEDCKRLGLKPTEENINLVLEARRKAGEEESKYCRECGRPHD
jgi:hypothetical protein